ncbi:hypothetical protein LTR17_000010 [Elasticomyces elasticus]|nr:hypothetical protein LTR17_000010 [Elasticomyces elasticus]
MEHEPTSGRCEVAAATHTPPLCAVHDGSNFDKIVKADLLRQTEEFLWHPQIDFDGGSVKLRTILRPRRWPSTRLASASRLKLESFRGTDRSTSRRPQSNFAGVRGHHRQAERKTFDKTGKRNVRKQVEAHVRPQAGFHDLERVLLEKTMHDLPTKVCNKVRKLYPSISNRISTLSKPIHRRTRSTIIPAESKKFNKTGKRSLRE